ncbi:cyclin-like protein [Chiua virens]|nr:cyclin-like protein [Chiua virens]
MLPTRRVTRAAVSTHNENATSRPTTRSKPPSKGPQTATTQNTALTRATAPTAASRAKANENDVDAATQGKRKRDALAQVPKNANKSKTALAPKEVKSKPSDLPSAKAKFDGVVIKTKPPPSTGNRQPLSTVAATRRASKAVPPQSQVRPLEDVKEDIELAPLHADDAMAIDAAPHAPITNQKGARRPSTSAASRIIKQEVHRADLSKRTASHLNVKVDTRDEDDNRVFKKRRTSSDIPDDAKLLEEQEEHEAQVAASLDAGIDSEPEADPNGNEWDDLDAEDTDDPLMVSEYVIEIFDYMKQVELSTLPNPDYMSSQKELAWSMRGILLDWLVQVHARFRLLPETFFLCVNIIDRFLSARVVSLAKLQLVGITCLFVSSKVEEIVAPSVSHFLHCADSSYTESEILLAERYVLKTIDWNLSYPNPMHFLRRISKADDYDVKARTIGKYLLEVGALEWRLLATPPVFDGSRVALSANLAHFSSYAESSLLPTANLMLNYVLKPVRHESFHRKYAGKRFLKVSIWVREWALERWEESTQVSLGDDLGKLKALCRADRQRLDAEHGNVEGVEDDS